MSLPKKELKFQTLPDGKILDIVKEFPVVNSDVFQAIGTPPPLAFSSQHISKSKCNCLLIPACSFCCFFPTLSKTAAADHLVIERLQCITNLETIEQSPVKWELNPLPDDKILDWSKLKQIADDILKCI